MKHVNLVLLISLIWFNSINGADKAASRVFAFLKSTPYIKSVGLNALQQIDAIKDYGKKNKLSGTDLLNKLRERTNGSLFPPCFSNRHYSDEALPFPGNVSCCPLPKVRCYGGSTYRTIDGSCNCEAKPDMGRSNRAFRRLLDPEYADGIKYDCPCCMQFSRSGDLVYTERKPSGLSSVFYGSPGLENCIQHRTGVFYHYSKMLKISSNIYLHSLNSPRVAKDGKPLPSPRLISTSLFEAMPGKHNGILTQLHFSTGQVVDHDMDRTPISKNKAGDGSLVDVHCGSDGCQTSNPEDKECFPIPVPANDTFFPGPCLTFVRSQIFFADNCAIGPRQQANALTSWLDASQVYGSEKKELFKLRELSFVRGRMRTEANPVHPQCGRLLPFKDDPECRGVNDKIKCFQAGDERQNEQFGLTAMHTIFVRLHNKIEENLHKTNKKWYGRRLFQESRKLLIGIWQNIIYREFLPLLLGDKLMTEYKLDVLKDKDCFNEYDCESNNADVPNVFATAAYRYGHSQVGKFMKLSNADFNANKEVPLSSIMFNPFLAYSNVFSGKTCGIDAILLGVSSQSSDRTDRFFTHQVTRHLFTDNPPFGKGMDLASLNIQRGRDHGIAGYTKWRKFCKLSVPTSFSTMDDIPADIQSKFQHLYEHIDDVDLYPAGVAETNIEGGAIGPTFACIIATHFQNVKFADRFWFERCDTKEGFTEDQIANIRQYTFGRFYCDTLDSVKTIQKFPMMVSLQKAAENLGTTTNDVKQKYPLYQESTNERVACSQHPGIDFKLWKD